MIALPPSVRIYLCAQPVDGGRGIDALAAMVRSTLALEPLSGHLGLPLILTMLNRWKTRRSVSRPTRVSRPELDEARNRALKLLAFLGLGVSMRGRPGHLFCFVAAHGRSARIPEASPHISLHFPM